MTDDTNYYYVTPPDLVLNTADYSILIIGSPDVATTRRLIDRIEKNIQTKDIIFYFDDTDRATNILPWYRALTSNVDLIMLDVENSTKEETMIAFMAESNDQLNVMYYALGQDNTSTDVFRSYGSPLLGDLEVIGEVVADALVQITGIDTEDDEED